jgi:hypothetical protein
MSSMNIPLMLHEHGRNTVEELDREIRAVTERLALLHQQRAIVRAHIALGEAFAPMVQQVALEFGHEAV